MNREKMELFEFCRHKLNNDTLVFDEILNIYDRVYDFLEEEKASGMMVRQYVNLKEGISKDNSKKINKLIKEYKLKVQSQIQGDQLRVTSKKIDLLQDVMKRLNAEKLDIALQYINLKK